MHWSWHATSWCWMELIHYIVHSECFTDGDRHGRPRDCHRNVRAVHCQWLVQSASYVDDCIVLFSLTSFETPVAAKRNPNSRIRCWRASHSLPMKHVGVSGHYRCVHVPRTLFHVPRTLAAAKLSRIPVRCNFCLVCPCACAAVMLPSARHMSGSSSGRLESAK